MKTGIHPTYNDKVTAKCACGATFDLGSTLMEIHTEICSACHPFYTGKQKLIDSAGQVDKFMAKMKKSAQVKEQKAKKDELVDSAEGEATLVDAAPKKPAAKKAPAKKKAAKK